MTETYTPMLQQYREIKSRHLNDILFFRLGDFYEMFFEDAETASRELEITLTGRDGGGGRRIPMCGVPYHAADGYIAKLIEKGYKVAICEQVEDPRQAQGIVRREVIKVITPGTVLSDQLLPDKANNYLVVLLEEDDLLCFAAADISTGECMWGSFSGPARSGAVCDRLFCLAPAEIIFVGKIVNAEAICGFVGQRLPACAYSAVEVDDFSALRNLPPQHFGDGNLPAAEAARDCVAYLLYYLHDTVKSDLTHVNRLVRYEADAHLLLDNVTLRNLEISRNIRDGGKKGTLLGVLDHTQTAMGARLLKRWVEQPLNQPGEITARLDAVDELVRQPSARACIREQLRDVYDFERIVTKIEIGTANARDLTALRQSLAVLPPIKETLAKLRAKLFSGAAARLSGHADIVQMIGDALVDNPPAATREGGMIRLGYDLELDELRTIARDSKLWIQNLEAKERDTTGIRSLKIGYNRVFGYYLEVTHANAKDVPAHYTRKQTLANAERYITPELKEFELKVLGAEEKIVALEYQLFASLRETVKRQVRELQQTARQVALLDAACSLSEAAVRNNYIKPVITADNELRIKDGRHPVVEKLLQRERFIPNDTGLNHSDCEVMIITGPNMAGKSTYMRQVALLTVMAQIGSFVPAREAFISPVDRIFTRVGASDDLSSGQSTFMVEMAEVSHILKHATAKSLIILDEIGRGTSTYDGMSIARAVIEHIKSKIKAKTLFSTHYHELTELEKLLNGVKNFSVAVKERGNEVVFLRRIVPGGADKSYGVHVAQLAGLPRSLIERAHRILAEHEQPDCRRQAAVETAAAVEPVSVSLFSSALADELLALDVMTLTPLEALNCLYKLQLQAKAEAGKL
ncbi:MAG: DNA mismatch repair protein MutS [Sporomusaceae bacterium]|nr:DNA mismatch repair protein MutS [Sporomusaceae bacterium]